MEHRRLRLPGVHRPSLQVHSVLHHVSRRAAPLGVFLDNTWRTSFDFSKVARDAYTFGCARRPARLLHLLRPRPEAGRRAARPGSPGHTPLPPLWSLGFQQSRYSYYPEPRCVDIANAPARGPHPRRRHLPRHRLPAEQPALHRRPRALSALRPDDRRISQRSTSRPSPSPTCTSRIFPTRATSHTTAGIAGDHFVKNAGRLDLRRRRVAGARRLSRLHAQASTRDWWGTLYTDVRARTASPASGTT